MATKRNTLTEIRAEWDAIFQIATPLVRAILENSIRIAGTGPWHTAPPMTTTPDVLACLGESPEWVALNLDGQSAKSLAIRCIKAEGWYLGHWTVPAPVNKAIRVWRQRKV